MKNFTPNIVILIIVLFLVCSGAAIYFNRQTIPVSRIALNPEIPAPEKSRAPAMSASAEKTASGSSDSEDVFVSSPKSSPTTRPSAHSLVEDYIYPGASVVNKTGSKLELESNADAGVITQWYKDSIRQSGFNAKSFSQTNTNGVIFNKLSAAKPGEKIEISIKKDQNASKVTITVDRP